MENKAIKYRLLLILTMVLLLVSCGENVTVSDYSVVPEPVSVVKKGRTFTLNRHTKVCFGNMGQNTPTAKYIAKSLRQMHIRPAFIGTPDDNTITFSLNDSANDRLGDEGYLLNVRPEGIYISANTEAGLFYGYQTLLQMLPDDIHVRDYRSITLPECSIVDYPRFSWRGSHLDVCRHFFTVKQIEKHLDLMAAYKLNKFHWHLTDDHGWRIEIEKYPQLNDIGSWRVDRTGTPWGEEQPPRPDEEPTYGGFYSRQEIAEIVAYAAQRNIEVIPEIDLPAHCSSILAAMPQLACDTTPYTVAIGPCWPPRAILCLGNDATLQFVRDILGEVAQLFPSQYIHIGGDAPIKDNWESCPKCQKRMRSLGLANEDQFCAWFLSQVEEYLTLKGKQLVAWDDVVEHNAVSSDAVVMAWSNTDKALQAAASGFDIVMALPEYSDLSYYQADSAYQPLAMGAYLSLFKAYQHDPVPVGLTLQQSQHVLGGEALLWTDFVNTYEQAEYMLLPRLCAIAENFWTPLDRKDWLRFREKIEHRKATLRANGYACCDGSFKPVVTKTLDGGEYLVTLTTEVAGTYLYYTTDGSDPTPESPLYTTPMRLPPNTRLRVLSLYLGHPREGIYEFKI